MICLIRYFDAFCNFPRDLVAWHARGCTKCLPFQCRPCMLQTLCKAVTFSVMSMPTWSCVMLSRSESCTMAGLRYQIFRDPRNTLVLAVIECRLKPTVSTYPESSPPGTAAWFGTTSALILWTWAGNHARDSISLALLLLFCLCKAKKPCSGCASNPLRSSSVCGELTNYTLQILLQLAPFYSGNCCIMVAAHSLSPLLSLVVKLSLFTGLRL